MNWKRGLTYMFLVGRLKLFFQLIFIWIPQTLALLGLDILFNWEIGWGGVMGLMFIVVTPINLFFLFLDFPERYIKGDEWMEEQLLIIQQERLARETLRLRGFKKLEDMISSLFALIAFLFFAGGLFGILIFGWQQIVG